VRNSPSVVNGRHPRLPAPASAEPIETGKREGPSRGGKPKHLVEPFAELLPKNPAPDIKMIGEREGRHTHERRAAVTREAEEG
jgi:hypothetical protein